MAIDAITYYVRGAFADAQKTPQMLEQQQELIADLSDRAADLAAAGHSEQEAVGLAIASIGDIGILVPDASSAKSPHLDRLFPAPSFVVANAARLQIHTAIITTAITLAVFTAIVSVLLITGRASSEWLAFGAAGAAAGIGWLIMGLISLHVNESRTASIQVGGTQWLLRGTKVWGLSFAVVLIPIGYANLMGSWWTLSVLAIPSLGIGFLVREVVVQYLLRKGRFLAANASE